MNLFIFDIDGTLVDTGRLDNETFHQALCENGYPFAREELLFAFGMPGRSALRMLHVREEDAPRIMQRWEKLLYSRLDEMETYPGVCETLEALRAAGKKCGVVTSRTRYQLEAGFTPLGLNHYFDAIVCADDVAHPKPAPDSLIECIRLLGGTAEQAVYTGDSAYDMQCAQAAGVTSALALWGCRTPEALSADVRLAHPSELLRL